MLERAVYYEGLTKKSAEELAALSREVGSNALIEVNKKAFEFSQRDATHRPHLSAYPWSLLLLYAKHRIRTGESRGLDR